MTKMSMSSQVIFIRHSA